ncbi:hypothetical protein [Paenibacillus sp. OV219]|nr:hypothetical protein [Paenibacillus sp. OV219]SEP05734.1 hypothetical protein SAMN05518847_11535 [Paenibacillus sp. OV219]
MPGKRETNREGADTRREFNNRLLALLGSIVKIMFFRHPAALR